MITKKIYLYFPKSETEKPIVYQLVKQFDLIVNIFRAKVTSEEEGYLSLEVTGTQENIDRAFEFLNGFDVDIHAGNKGMIWDAGRCGQCGACVVHCPTGALSIVDRASLRCRLSLRRLLLKLLRPGAATPDLRCASIAPSPGRTPTCGSPARPLT